MTSNSSQDCEYAYFPKYQTLNFLKNLSLVLYKIRVMLIYQNWHFLKMAGEGQLCTATASNFSDLTYHTSALQKKHRKLQARAKSGRDFTSGSIIYKQTHLSSSAKHTFKHKHISQFRQFLRWMTVATVQASGMSQRFWTLVELVQSMYYGASVLVLTPEKVRSLVSVWWEGGERGREEEVLWSHSLWRSHSVLCGR